MLANIGKDDAFDLVDRLSSFPYPFVGEVVSGTPEDLATAEYLKGEMEHLGLTDVTIEPFDLVAWDFNIDAGAALEVLDSTTERTFPRVRAIDGCPPNSGRRSGRERTG